MRMRKRESLSKHVVHYRLIRSHREIKGKRETETETETERQCSQYTTS